MLFAGVEGSSNVSPSLGELLFRRGFWSAMGKVNADEMDWTEPEEGRTQFKRKQLGEAVDGE